MDTYIFQVLFGIIILIGIMFGAKYFHKKMMLSNRVGFNRSRYMQSLDRLPLTNDKWIEIIEINKEKIVIGVTQHGISVLKTLGDEELMDVETGKRKNVFSDLLEKYYKKKNDI